jgi:hypothetical protein
MVIIEADLDFQCFGNIRIEVLRFMKITIYVITYRNDKILNEWFLASLASSIYPKEKVCLQIQNNFSDKVNINDEYKPLINYIHHNTMRLDRSTGHLARDWNHGIMNGFVDLNRPNCDVVMLLQNDTKLEVDWYTKVCNIMEKNIFASYGAGDQCMLIRPTCVKKVGMFDERYCNILGQESDYFLRCIWRTPMHTSINDEYHGRVHRPFLDFCPTLKTATGSQRREGYHMASVANHPVSSGFWRIKWPFHDRAWRSTWQMAKEISQNGAPFIPMYMMYPYFERAIDPTVYEKWSLLKLI